MGALEILFIIIICRSATISAFQNAEASPKTSLLNVYLNAYLPWDSHDTSQHHSSQPRWHLGQTLEQGVQPWFLQQVFKVFMNSSTGTTALTDLTATEPLFTFSLPKNVCCWCNSFDKKSKAKQKETKMLRGSANPKWSPFHPTPFFFCKFHFNIYFLHTHTHYYTHGAFQNMWHWCIQHFVSGMNRKCDSSRQADRHVTKCSIPSFPKVPHHMLEIKWESVRRINK